MKRKQAKLYIKCVGRIKSISNMKKAQKNRLPSCTPF